MNNQIDELITFLSVIEEASFTKAARILNQSPSAISKKINRLESRLNTKLINRSTRSLIPTEAGEKYYRYCKRIHSDIVLAEEDVTEFNKNPSGKLIVNCGAGFAQLKIFPHIPEFLERYPYIELSLLTGRIVNFYKDKIDLSIEHGIPTDSSLICRQLMSDALTICASPNYLKLHGSPTEPEDLQAHNCCIMNVHAPMDKWEFEDSKGFRRIKVHGNFHAPGVIVVKAVLAGLGIGQLPWYLVSPYIEQGSLVRLLEEKQPENKRAIYLAFPYRKHLSAKIRVFIDFLMEKIR